MVYVPAKRTTGGCPEVLYPREIRLDSFRHTLSQGMGWQRRAWFNAGRVSLFSALHMKSSYDYNASPDLGSS